MKKQKDTNSFLSAFFLFLLVFFLLFTQLRNQKLLFGSLKIFSLFLCNAVILKILFFALSVAIRLKFLKPCDNLKNPNNLM